MVDLSPATPSDAPLVLLVDEDADTREMYRVFLTGSGFAVDEAAGGQEALAKVRRVIPDIVVTDVVLPGTDGFALCREIKRDERTARIPVIAVTGYSTATRAEEAAGAGFDAFLMKPCLPDELLARIRQTIQTTRCACARSTELHARSETLRRSTEEVCRQSAEILRRLSDDNGPLRWRRR